MSYLCLEAWDKEWPRKGETQGPSLTLENAQNIESAALHMRKKKLSGSKTQGDFEILFSYLFICYLFFVPKSSGKFFVSFINVSSSPATCCYICLIPLQFFNAIEPCSWASDYLPMLVCLECNLQYNFYSCVPLPTAKSSSWWHVHLRYSVFKQ